jgi:hypothetical protein
MDPTSVAAAQRPAPAALFRIAQRLGASSAQIDAFRSKTVRVPSLIAKQPPTGTFVLPRGARIG